MISNSTEISIMPIDMPASAESKPVRFAGKQANAVREFANVFTIRTGHAVTSSDSIS